MALRFGDFSLEEMAEFDFSRVWRSKVFKPVTIESQSKYHWVWKKLDTRQKHQKPRTVKVAKRKVTPKEAYGKHLRRKYAGNPFGFLFKFERFLGYSKSKLVAPFYKDIYDQLKKDFLIKTKKVKQQKRRIQYGVNRYEVLTVDPVGDYEPTKEELEYVSPPTPRKKKLSEDRSNILIGPCWSPQPEVRYHTHKRWKLHSKLDILKFQRMSKHQQFMVDFEKKYCKFKCWEDSAIQRYRAYPEMEGQQGEELLHPQAGNVILSEQNPASNTLATKPTYELQWSDTCSNERATDYTYLTDRWTLIKSSEWTSAKLTNTEITELKFDLPLDVRNLGTGGGTPIRAPFDIFSYYRTDIEIKIHVNSNKFQMGQLQFSFQYMDHLREKTCFDNVYSRSQLSNVIINAGASNEATLYIPYKNMTPYMSTKYGCIGSLRCFVISPLNSGDNCPKKCGIVVYARLPRCEFVGMRDGSIAFEMEAAAAAMVAGQVMDRVIGDRNCDQPVDAQNPSYIVPTASHTWSLSSGLTSKLHNLRLMGPTSQVGRSSGIDPSETSIGVPCRTFGMLKHIAWNATATDTNKYGYELWRCDAHPQLSKSKFYKKVNQKGLDNYAVPPVTVVSSLYKQWRGTLEFKFDVVSTQFHTGRLLVAYIPGISGKVAVSLDQARNSPCAEFSLQDSSSFTFTVPYISPITWWPRKYGGPADVDGFAAPSMVIIFILNPLVYMESVPKSVTLVPYVRGGIDFEVSVPVQPAVSLGRNFTINIKDLDKVYPDSKSIPYRVTKSQKFYDSTLYVCYEGSDTLGTVAGWHPTGTPMTKDSHGKINQCYYSKADDIKHHPVVTWNMYNNTTKQWEQQKIVVGFVVLWFSTDDNYWYGIPFPAGTVGETRAKMVASGLLLGKTTEQINSYLFNYVEDSGWSSSKQEDLKFTPFLLSKAECKRLWPLSDSYEIINAVGNPEMEERYQTLNLLNPVPALRSTGCGSFTFNENFSDLKDLCRRYQLYVNHDISLDGNFNSGEGIATVPIFPAGLALDTAEPESIWNFIRDGHIPMISDGYVYFRGSIRMRIILSSMDECFNGSSVWIQHHADMPFNYTHTPDYYPKLSSDDKLKCHGYGFYIQNLNINRTIEVEIPFYQAGMYGLLGTVHQSALKKGMLQSFMSLGNLVIGLCTPCITEKKTVNLQMYYSIGDDMSFSTFRGFDMVCFTDEVWKPDTVNRPEIENAFSGEADPEMWASICSGVVSSLASMGTSIVAKGASTALAHNIKKDIGIAIGEAIASRISDPIYEVSKELKQAKKELRSQIIEGFKDNVLVGLLCQLAHIAVSPTLATVAVSFASILAQILNLTVNQLTLYTDACRQFFFKTWNHFSHVVLPDAPHAGMPESDFDLDECERTLIALLFTSICTLFGCSSITAPKGCGDLLRGVNSGVCLFNNFVRLLENCGKVIKKFIKYIQSKLNPEVYLAGLLDDDCPEVEKWVKEVQFLLDARNKERFIYDRLMLARVFDAATFGALLVSNGLDERKPGGKVLWDLYKEIRKLRNDLCERGAHPDVRFETFPIWITGAPGIGKSFMVSDLSNRLLRAINHRAPGSMIYYIQPGAKYWSGVTNPAVLVSDDMFQVGGTRLEEELANIFMICSSSVLNPPMAAVEDKERRLNPYLYVMLANSSFPDLGSVCRTATALYRRRKFLIEADFTDHIKQNFPDILDSSDLPRNEVQNFNHLQFRIAHSAKSVDTTWSQWMNYEELVALIQERFARHFEAERANFRDRMIHMYNLDPNFNELNLVDQIPVLENMASLREQMDIVRARIAQQIDEINDPMREPDQDAWYYIRKFKDYVAGLHNNPEMAPPAGYARTEPGNIRVDGCSIASADGYRHRMNDFNGIFNFQEAFSNHMASLRPSHHEELHPYYQRYLEYFSDLHKVFVCQAAKLPESIKADFSTMYEQYPHCELMGIDLFLNSEVRNMAEHWYIDGFVRRYMEAGACPGMLHDFTQFNVTPYESLQFLMHETHRSGDIAKFLVAGIEPQEFCTLFDQGVLSKFNTHRTEAGYRVPTLAEVSPMASKGAAELECFLSRYTRDDNYFQAVGESLCTRFNQLPAAIKDKLNTCICYNDLYDACRLVMLLPNEINGMYVDGKYIGLAMTCIILTLQCLYDVHRCDLQVSYQTRPTYCHIRNNLVAADGKRITTCDRAGCKYSNELYYLFGCHYSFSHAYIESRNYSTIPETVEYVHFSLTSDSIMRLRRNQRTTEALDSFKDYVKDFFFHTLPTKLWELFIFVLEYLPYIIGGLLTMYRLYQGYQFFFGEEPKSEADPEANYFKFNQPKFPQKPKIPTADKVFHTPEMSTEQRQVMINRINRNGVLLYVNWVQDGTRMNRNCRCLMLGGRNMLALRHYLEEYSALVEAGYKLNVDLVFGNKMGDPVKVNIKFEELMDKVAYCDNSNFCIVVLPKFVRMFSKIYPYFATRANHDNVSGRVDMITIAGESSFDLTLGVSRNFVVSATQNSSEVMCEKVYSYAKRSPGLCGSVIISNSLGSGNGAIIGMHIAGNATNGTGYAEPLYQEMFSQFFQALPTRDVLEPTIVDISNADVKLDGNMFMYGCVPDRFAHKESGKTNIVPSLLYNQIYPAVTEVNPLRPNDPRQPPGSHPLRDGCNKHGSGNIYNFEKKDVDAAIIDMTDKLNQTVKPLRAEIKPLTLQQAVCGDINVPHFEALNWKSSEGFPLSSFRPINAHDKKWLFTLEDGEFGYNLKDIDIRLKQQMKLRDECFRKNIKPPTVYIDCLKDYRLKPEKCAKPGSTRVFSVAPIQCSLDIRMHLSDFTASLKQSHIFNSIGIGINPDSIEWTQLVNYLFEVGPCIITLDYSNFGPCLMSQMVAASNECIVNWHRLNGASEEHVERVEWLLDCDILNPVHLCSNVLYQTVNGISSGSPLTGECNSIPNLFYIRCTYLEVMREKCKEFANMYYFNLFVRIVVYGDDLIMSVSPDIIDYFNALTIRDSLASHGITVTSAKKNEELQPFDDIYAATFLKRSFKEHPTRKGIWLAPVEKDSVQECVNWMHRCDDAEAATLEVVQASLDLAYGHGPEYYNEHRLKLIEACKKINVLVNSKSWYERDCEIFGENITEISTFNTRLPWYYKLDSVQLTIEADSSKLTK